MEQQYISKSTSTKAIDQILLSSDELVFLSGIGGMGKTTLLDMFTYKWAKGDLHNEAANIEFIFKFTCRNLNNISNSFTNLEELFRLKFPAVMKFISFHDLMEISERVLIVVDGLDELKNLYVTENSSTFTTNNLSQIVIDLLNPKGHWLPKHKVIACGRPKASEFVKKHLPMNSKRKTIEVCGFNDENIRKYIQKFFGDHKEKAVAVQEIIERSYDLHIMARVPVFLYIICNVYQEELIKSPINTLCNVYQEELIKSPINTQTELYFFTTLVFIRNHFKKQSQPYTTLMDIVKNETVAEILLCLMELSTTTYMQNKVVFGEAEIESLRCPVALEETGFLSKHSSNFKEATFQFRHLILQTDQTYSISCTV